MKFIRAGAGMLTAFALTACATAPAPQAITTSEPRAHLVIAGGALRSFQADVYSAFIDAAGVEGPVLIVPAASSEPMQSARRTTNALIRNGVAAERIQTLPIAIEDDPSTEADESLWADNANSAELSETILQASGIWFTGGDQARIAAILLNEEDGSATPVLEALRQARSDGTVVGGSSAGAAIMSTPMIVEGDSLASLHPDGEKSDFVELADGIGFFEGGMIDQHFGERARLGRLVRALLESPSQDMGFGIDENTALIVRDDGSYKVAGTGFVTLVDISVATFRIADDGSLFAGGLQISLLSRGDTFDPKTKSITPASFKAPTIGSEYEDSARKRAAGITAPLESIATVIGQGLVDTAGTFETSRVGFTEDGRGVKFTFRQTEVSRGYWGRDAYGAGRYTVENVDLSIRPVQVEISETQF